MESCSLDRSEAHLITNPNECNEVPTLVQSGIPLGGSGDDHAAN
jgi:hypothetical protein